MKLQTKTPMISGENPCQALLPGGWLVFDTATQHNSRRYFEEDTQCEEMDGGVLIRHAHWDQAREFQHNDFSFFEPRPDGLYERQDEAHVQRIYTEATMRQAVEDCGFSLAGVYQGFTFRPPGPRAERVHWVARKA